MTDTPNEPTPTPVPEDEPPEFPWDDIIAEPPPLEEEEPPNETNSQ